MKIAFLISHPIQVYASFFRSLSKHPDIDLTVYFCIKWGAEEFFDPEFAKTYKWDIPIVEGYKHIFLKNYSPKPSNAFFGQINPGIISELKREKYDAIIIHGYTSVTNWLAFFGSLLSKTPIFFRGISHILDKKPWYIRVAKQIILSLLFKICAACLFIGKNNKNYYKQYGVPESKLFFVPHIVDNDFFQGFYKELSPERGKIRQSFGFSDDRPIILFTGKLISKKRPLLVLKAYEKIRKEHFCGLLFAGDGQLRGEIENLVKKNNIPDVVITGFLNQTELPKAYISGDVLVLPSDVGETWGLVINEGMNFGLPIVVSNKVGCGPDLVRENENGYIFSSLEELYDSLLKLIVNEELRIKFGKKSKEIINTWGIPECVENIVEALKSVNKKRNSKHE